MVGATPDDGRALFHEAFDVAFRVEPPVNPDATIVGIAGDNSKTDVAVVTADGTVLAAIRGAAATPNELGPDACAAALHDAIRMAWADAGLARSEPQAAVATFFMAGLDSPSDERGLLEAIQKRRLAPRIEVANDVFALLWAATGTAHGIAVFFGGGINCVGRSAGGRVVRFAALGAWTGDWGSGYDVGMAALGAAVQAEDGRGPATWLSRAVADYFRLPSATDVGVAIDAGRLNPNRVVELAPLVVTAGAIGDEAAEVILDRLADEVARFARAAIQRIGLEEADTDVVLGGSLLTGGGSTVIRRIEDRLGQVAPRARPVVCTVEPVVGAAVAGLCLHGASKAAIQRTRDSLIPSRLRVVGGRAFLNVPGH
jgi:N-acetylglucosamine kinase-like BadF-type ATPase